MTPFASVAILEKLALLKIDRKSTRLNSSHLGISYAVFCLKKKNSLLHGAVGLSRATTPSRRRPHSPPAPPTRAQATTSACADPLYALAMFFFLKERAPREVAPFPPPDPLPV